MKVGIFTSFTHLDPGYSLCAVVIDQLHGLIGRGYKPVLFTLPMFKDEALLPEGVEVRKVVPQIILEPYKGTEYPAHWKDDTKKVTDAVKEHCADITHLICHDIFFIDSFLPYNIGIRDALPGLPDMKILAWVHSAPSTRPVLENNPHASRYALNDSRIKLVYLNYDKAQVLAEMYGAWLKDVRVVMNSRDPRTFWDLHPLVLKIIQDYSLFFADIVTVYPLSTPRMISGKGLDKVVKIHSNLKLLGYKTRLIVCNAHANAVKDKKMLSDFKVWAAGLDIAMEEICFTSEQSIPDYELGVPPKVVSDLFRLSNVFIFPTVSENSSLVLLEAMLSGNLLVLNEKVGTLREHAGTDALYMDFDYREPKEKNEAYYLDLAKIIASQFEVSIPMQAKRHALQKHNYDIIGRNIDILLHEI